MPNGTYGGVRGGRKSLLLDCNEKRKLDIVLEENEIHH